MYDYIADIDLAIESGQIIAAKEYYSQLRLKGHSKGSVLEDLKQNGINYIEVRTLDLNPLIPLGVTLDSLELIHLFMVYALLAPDFYLSDEEYRLANGNQVLAADGNYADGIMLHYDAKKTIASFVGFAPADDPKFVMLVTLREPSSSQWGSETAAPLFFSIAKDIFLYMGIAPQL